MEHTAGSLRVPRTPREVREFFNNGTDVARIEFFSDAVFAIAITLLALEIKIPETPHHADNATVLAALGSLGRILFSYVFSFALIGMQWIRHHALFRLIRRHDLPLLLLNMLGLMFVTLVPLPTSLYGNHISSPVAVAVFYGFHTLTALIWVAMWVYASSKNRLVAPELPKSVVRFVTMQQCAPAITMGCGMVGVLLGGVQFGAIAILLGVMVSRVVLMRMGRPSRADA